MITRIENALIDRLKRGLGKLVYEVKSYEGEIDDARLAVNRMPLVLVSYGGSRFVSKTMTGRGVRYQHQDTFVVIVMVRNLRGSQAARQGGVDKREVGANQLVSAVQYLLVNQTLGRLVEPIKPLRVQTLLNNAEVRNEKLTAYAIEFEISYSLKHWLEDGHYPEPTQDKQHPDYIFNAYQGQLSELTPDLVHIQGKIYDPNSHAQVGIAVETKVEE
ncbi:phage protein Gp37 [Volucribacter amazonae]|uniref:Mu-like prophage protein gp37 n=1 Tax=Volucribacter amazonae TaxID=256731 RepID=A0A9X4PB67_9PAST|nr:phage protein Gp37 [Volucribacter amazonae]MDG6895042.1 hypothetical protein [Volucribacter amazonae]